MNEVFYEAHQKGVKIYYQDTDSMHVATADISKLNPDLIGKNLGNFHSDFSLPGYDGELTSKRCIILGKKCYLDELYDNEGKHRGNHIRMKGIPDDVILAYCEGHKITTTQLYEQLYNGDTINFDLIALSTRPKFKYVGKQVTSVTEFKRNIKF
jgi:hypothetical protein